MENSKLPINYWVIALQHRFLTKEQNPKGTRIKELSKQLPDIRYATAWELSFKIDEELRKNNDLEIQDDPQETLLLKLLNLDSQDYYSQSELLYIYLEWLSKPKIN